MRYLLSAVSIAALAVFASTAGAAPPQLTAAQRQATHDMFEHIINTPTVIGRHNVPAMAQYVADQFKAGGFPQTDAYLPPYFTRSATTPRDHTPPPRVRLRAAGAPTAQP